MKTQSSRANILSFIFMLFVFVSHHASALCLAPITDDCESSRVGVEILNTAIGTSKSRVEDLFGLNSDFYSVQGSLTNSDGEFTQEGIKLLRSSGVNLVRNSGAANEINWNQCLGDPQSRQLQNVLTWSKPIKCLFGVNEYNNLIVALGATKTWHIANLLGYEFSELPTSKMAQEAQHYAAYTKEKSGNLVRFWELGNELSDGSPRWSKEKYLGASTVVANAILKADPDAKLVVPLLIFNTGWIKDFTEHNSFLVRNTKSYNPNFSIHTYYENKPEGLHIEEWIERIGKIEKTIKNAGITAPGIWVTEHARWPKGNPSIRDWKDNWQQTNDYQAVLHVASYLFALSQIESINGAMWHALRGGPWNFIFVDEKKSIYLSPVAQLFWFLNRDRKNLDVLKVNSKYNLDKLVFTALKNRTTGELLVWCVNRSTSPVDINFSNKNNIDGEALFKVETISGIDKRSPVRALEISKNEFHRDSAASFTLTISPQSILSVSISNSGNVK